VKDVARTLLKEDEAPRLIFSSPLVRALETAEIVAALTIPTGHQGALEVRRELEPGGEARTLVTELLAESGRMARAPETGEAATTGPESRVMLVGHEPDLSSLAELLSGRRFPAGLQKAMVVGVATRDEDPRAIPMRLRFVLDPKSLQWDAAGSDRTR
jgi:phosphohistidine phosphatase SixA